MRYKDSPVTLTYAPTLAELQDALEDLKLRESALTSSTWAPLEASSAAKALVARTNMVQITKRKRILGVRHSFGSMDLRFCGCRLNEL